MVERRTILLGIGGVCVVAFLVALVLIGPSDFFLPEDSTSVNEPVATDNDTQVLKRGTFGGKAGHDVSGTVSLVRDEEGLFLQFEDYEQTQGPDVFVYVTPSEDPDSGSEIAAGRKVRIDGGADDGESTKEGTFTQRLPDDVSADRINGVGIWCDQFSTPFGTATLSPVNLSSG